MMVHPWHSGSPWLAHTSTGLHAHDLHSVHYTWHFTTLYDIMLNYALHYTLLCEPQLSPTCTTVLHYWPLSIYLDCTAKARQRTPLVNLPFQLVTSSCWHRCVQSRAKYKTATVEMWSSSDGLPLLSGDRMLPLLYLIYLHFLPRHLFPQIDN